jgi:DNA-binding MarR family transcriptional regulator
MKHTVSGDLFTKIILESYKFTGLLTANGDKISEIYGLSSAKWKVIGTLIRSVQLLTVSEISQSMGQSRQGVQRIVNAMHKDGLVTFHPNPNHKRAKLISLTNKAEDIHAKLEEKQIPWADQLSKKIDKNALDITLNTIKQLYSLVDNQG